jgi:ABC-type multidrug transport system permease subunit
VILGRYITAATGILERDFRIFISYRTPVLTMFASGFFTISLFHFISQLVRLQGFTPDEYFAFAVLGIIIISVINSTLATPPGSLRQELVAGTFERLVLSPFGALGAVLSMMIWPLILALVNALGMLVFATVVYDMPIHWSTAYLAIPCSLLVALAFVPFGILLTASVLLIKQAANGASWIVAMLSLIGGLYFPVALLPEWIRWASDVQPFTPAADLLRHLLVGLLMTPLAAAAVHVALRVSRRRGTIIEY